MQAVQDNNYYPHMPIGKVCYPARIKLAASNFARSFMGVLGRESPFWRFFATQKPKISRRIGQRAH